MVNYIVTGVEVVDGYPCVWIVGKTISREEAEEVIEEAKEKYLEDYGSSFEENGVEFEVHKI